jgi:catechol 2,3-dioxygenase-like lactoylglutathione lyase family enzyme
MAPRTTGFNHVAALTADLDRFVAFYQRVFGAQVSMTIEAREDHPRMAVLDIGAGAHLNAVEAAADEIVGDRARMGGRGPLDHYAFAVGSQQELEALRDRLVAEGASPGIVTDFGSALSVFFRDPDGAELEVCWNKPSA